MGVFDSKIFNSEVFAKYIETVPRVKQNAFLKAGILRTRNDLQSRLTESDSGAGNYITVPMSGRIGGAVLNYDGNTDITATGIDTYSQSMIVVGRAKAWQEKDFTQEITHKNFMEVIASQVSDYFDDVDVSDIIAILKGIFGVTTSSFATKNSLDVSGNVSTGGRIEPTTLTDAMQQAAGANSNIFTLIICHSKVAANLKKQELIEYRKYNDGEAIQRRIPFADWDGRTVLIDDEVPVERSEVTAGVYEMTISTKAASGDKITINGVTLTAGTDFSLSTDTAAGNAAAIATALGASTDSRVSKYTWTSSSTKLIATEKTNYYNTGRFSAIVTQTAGGTMVVTAVSTATAPVVEHLYTTYVLGTGCIDFCNCGAKVPYETWRDPKTKGGVDWLIARQRKLYAPRGFSYVNNSNISPTASDLENPLNWDLVASTTSGVYYPTKSIPIARIISKG